MSTAYPTAKSDPVHLYEQVVWRWDNTDPYGNNLPNENPGGLGTHEYNLGFPGQYRDKETGLSYNYYRDYDPSIGSYIESDPIGLRGGLNTYAYVAGKPLMATDPRGLMLCGDWGWMAVDWALGFGSRNRTYGEFSNESMQLRNLPIVSWARNRYIEKNKKAKSEGCCDESKLRGVDNVASRFGLLQFIEASRRGSCAWHFIGSFDLDVQPISCTRARFTVRNNSSFTSFSYGVGPSWEGGPMGNFRQTYIWEEDL